MSSSVPGPSAPALGELNSYRIFSGPRSSAKPSAGQFAEHWAHANQVLSLSLLAAAFGTIRSVNLVVLVRVLAPVFNSLSAPMIGRNVLGVVACVSALVGLINPRRSPHRAVSSVYYRIISSLFVPRFVTNSVWAISADSVDWKQLLGVPGSAGGSSSVAGSQLSHGGGSDASAVRSFRLSNSSFTKRRYARSADGSRVVVGLERGGREKETKKDRTERTGTMARARSVDLPSASAVSTPGQSPRTLRLRKGSNQPKMSRIVSGQSLTLAELQAAGADERAARQHKIIDGRRKNTAASLPEARTPPNGSIPEDTACPLSPAASIESSASFSRSVSDYVDSWVQSLKGATVSGTASDANEGKEREEGEDACSPRRASLDLHGAHRHYVHGSVTANDKTIVPLLDKYALAAQLQAKNLIETRVGVVPGHLNIAPKSASTHRPASALESIGLDGDCPDAIRRIITDEHLLQFGDLVGEEACTQLLRELSIEHACASPAALFGLPDVSANVPWEKSSAGGKEGMTVAAERRLLRDNYYMYRTVAQIHGVEPSVVRPFHLDDQARSLWDDSCIACERDTPPGELRVSKHSESCMHRYISRFPRPLSGRKYEYARRVWTRPSDGGCYAICKQCRLPSGDGPAKYCLVKEYISACLIEATETGTRITTVYFENNQARPGLNKIAVPKGLLPFWFKYEASLRTFAQAKESVTYRRRSLDEAPLPAERCEGTDEASSDVGSDDEVYGALAELKRRTKEQRERKRLRRGDNEQITRWARRVLALLAVKLAMEGGES